MDLTGNPSGCGLDDAKRMKYVDTHIHIETEDVEGYVQCEKMALLDLNIRGYSKIDRIHYPDIINITDAIQGIFDYI